MVGLTELLGYYLEIILYLLFFKTHVLWVELSRGDCFHNDLFYITYFYLISNPLQNLFYIDIEV